MKLYQIDPQAKIGVVLYVPSTENSNPNIELQTLVGVADLSKTVLIQKYEILEDPRIVVFKIGDAGYYAWLPVIGECVLVEVPDTSLCMETLANLYPDWYLEEYYQIFPYSLVKGMDAKASIDLVKATYADIVGKADKKFAELCSDPSMSMRITNKVIEAYCKKGGTNANR